MREYVRKINATLEFLNPPECFVPFRRALFTVEYLVPIQNRHFLTTFRNSIGNSYWTYSLKQAYLLKWTLSPYGRTNFGVGDDRHEQP